MVVAAKKSGKDIRYGTMVEGHQTWNNVFMLTKGGLSRGQDEAFYKLMNVYLSQWFGARTLATFGFAPQMSGVDRFADLLDDMLRRRQIRIAHAEVDDVLAGAARRLHQLDDLGEDVRGQSGELVEVMAAHARTPLKPQDY